MEIGTRDGDATSNRDPNRTKTLTRTMRYANIHGDTDEVGDASEDRHADKALYVRIGD